MSDATLDIVLVNYRSAADTRSALARLEGWSQGTRWVLDNSAMNADLTDETAGLRGYCDTTPGVRYLATPENLGFGRACNLAWEQSRSDYLLLLNPDARITPQTLDQLANVMDAHPKLGALSPAIYWNDQQSFVLPLPSPQSPLALCWSAWRTRHPAIARRVANRAVQRTRSQMAAPDLLPTTVLAGAVLLLRRSAVLAAGGLFDPAYFMFFEDADLSLRLRRSGFGLAVAPHCRAVHEYRHKAFKAAWMDQSQRHFFSRNYPGFWRASTGLQQVQSWYRPMHGERWFDVLDGTCQSADDFALRTSQAGVLAWSPSPLMEPALCRPMDRACTRFDDDEWDLLEQGTYFALLQDSAGPHRPRWLQFSKA